MGSIFWNSGQHSNRASWKARRLPMSSSTPSVHIARGVLLLLFLLSNRAVADLFVDVPHFIEDTTAKPIFPPIEIIADGENSNSSDEAMTARLAIGCTAGHVSLPPSRAKVDIVPSDGIRSLEANGTVAALNAALSQATYTSARDNVSWRQKSSGQYEACEVHVELVVPEEATIRGERLVEKFLLDIIPVNDPPCIISPAIHRVLQDSGGYTVQRIDTLVAKEDEPLSIDLTISDVDIDPSSRPCRLLNRSALRGTCVRLHPLNA
jgi:hypothetical protein